MLGLLVCVVFAYSKFETKHKRKKWPYQRFYHVASATVVYRNFAAEAHLLSILKRFKIENQLTY